MTWPTKKLGDFEDMGIIKLGRGNVISKTDIEKTPGNYPIYSSSQQNEGEFGRYGRFMFNEELITWSVDGGGQFFYRPKHKYSVTNVCGWLRVLKHGTLNCKFLYYILYFLHKKLSFDYTFKAHPSVIRKMYKIFLPPLKIQQKIVERLDAIKKAQELNDKQIELAEELFQSLLHRELDPKGKNWEIKKLGDICEIARGGSPRPINSYLTKSSDGINWIKIGDVKEGEKYITSTEEKIKPEGISKTRLVKEGDLVLSNSMSFGRPYILKISGAIHDGWLLLHIKNKSSLSQDFLYYILGIAKTKIQFEKAASGGVVRNLNINLVKKVKILLPPLETQQKIVGKLQTVQDYKKKLIEQKLKLQELFESVLHKSMKGNL